MTLQVQQPLNYAQRFCPVGYYTTKPTRLILKRKSIYKFLKREFMEKLFHTGELLVGTLYGFRNVEKHGTYVGDEVEGRNRIMQFVQFADSVEQDSFLGNATNADGSAIRIPIENTVFLQHRDTPDAYAFCASHKYSEDGFREWFERKGYDACYEIFDPPGFRLAVSRGLRPWGRFAGEGAVEYVQGDVPGDGKLWRVPPMYIKQKEDYGSQSEYRWFWVPYDRDVPLTEKLPRVPAPIRFCRPFAVIENGQIKYLDQEASQRFLDSRKFQQ